jgi:plasmid stabilization system protein ParE
LARVALAAGARADLDRLFDFLAEEDLGTAVAAVDLILDGLSVLERHPLIGRPAEEAMRELVISRGRSGYVALYQYDDMEDVALVLALRHQREAGFPEER